MHLQIKALALALAVGCSSAAISSPVTAHFRSTFTQMSRTTYGSTVTTETVSFSNNPVQGDLSITFDTVLNQTSIDTPSHVIWAYGSAFSTTLWTPVVGPESAYTGLHTNGNYVDAVVYAGHDVAGANGLVEHILASTGVTLDNTLGTFTSTSTVNDAVALMKSLFDSGVAGFQANYTFEDYFADANNQPTSGTITTYTGTSRFVSLSVPPLPAPTPAPNPSNSVPEPGTLALVALGALGIGRGWRRRAD